MSSHGHVKMAKAAEETVAEMLQRMRDQPITNEGADDCLTKAFDFLTSATSKQTGSHHWFCTRSPPLLSEAATFLFRLHAYDGPKADEWKRSLAKVLDGCPNCVLAYQEAKFGSRTTYLGGYTSGTVETFFSSITAWEVGTILKSLNDAGVTRGAGSISNVSLGILCLMLSDLDLLQNADISPIIAARPPVAAIVNFSQLLPVGCLLLAFHSSDAVRTWALEQNAIGNPIPTENFHSGYQRVVELIISSLNCSVMRPTGSLDLSMDFLWKNLPSILPLLPQIAFSQEVAGSTLIRAVLGHLSNNPSVVNVVRALSQLITSCGESLWSAEADSPLQVFNSIRDNPYLEKHILNQRGTDELGRLFDWIERFALSTWTHSNFSEVLSTLAQYFAETLQHERFGSSRMKAMEIILATIYSIHTRAVKNGKDGNKLSQTTELQKVLRIHADTIITVAFARTHVTEDWSTARKIARKLLRSIFCEDIARVQDFIISLSDIIAGKPDRTPNSLKLPALHNSLWDRSFSAILPNDSNAMSLMTSSVALGAHIEPLSERAFPLSSIKPYVEKSSGDPLKYINLFLTAARAKYPAAVKTFCDSPKSTAAVAQVLTQNAADVVVISMCPIEDLQGAAQLLIENNYDVDDRAERFRTVLVTFPSAAFDGISRSVTAFSTYGNRIPEACSSAANIVRCLTDILSVICASHGEGLLSDSSFNSRFELSNDLLGLWKCVCRAAKVTFDRSVAWSTVVNNNNEMTDWMRDALIFGRDILKSRESLQHYAVPPTTKGNRSSRRTHALSRMVDDVQPMLNAVYGWLRLTHDELLHQSWNLFVELLDFFRNTDSVPHSATLTRLEAFADKELAKIQGKNPRGTRLTAAQLHQISSEVAAFKDEDEDEPFIIEDTKSAKFKPRIQQEDDEVVILGESRSTSRSNKTQQKNNPILVSSKLTSSTSSRTSEATSGRRQKPDLIPAKVLSGKIPPKLPLPAKPLAKPLAKPPAKPLVAPKKILLEDTEDEEEEEEEDGSKKGLAGMATLQKSPTIRRQDPAARRGIMIMEDPAVQKRMVEQQKRREEQDRRQRQTLRFRPDLSGLHKLILSWNYDHDGEKPPEDGSGSGKLTLLQVPDIFRDHAQYLQVFSPLLQLECWNQIINAKTSPPPKETVEGTICARQYTDEWVDLDLSLKVNGAEGNWFLSETDVILLRSNVDEKLCVLVKVSSFNRHPSKGLTAKVRAFAQRLGTLGHAMSVQSVWKLTKVFSLSTVHREFAALTSLQHYDYYNAIIQPKLSPIPHLDQGEVRKAMTSHRVNQPQAVAILSALKSRGFALIQGPPGTGKTSTICALVGRFMSTRKSIAAAIVPGQSASKNPILPKVLLCAPSNAAIDEVAKRLKAGVYNSSGELVSPVVVRVGMESKVNAAVKDITLEELVDQKMNLNANDKASNEFAILQAEMSGMKTELSMKQTELNTTSDNLARSQQLEKEISELKSKVHACRGKMDKARDQERQAHRAQDAARRKFKQEVLLSADVICCTLSASGHELLEQLEFDMIVIDEAAQSIELSSLIPLKYSCNRCILVGDPQQLAPTVLSPLATKFNYNQSLFVRIQKHHPTAVHLLSIQYRMHPIISALPSKLFYASRLMDGPDMATKTTQPWHQSPLLGVYKFFNATKGQEETSGKSQVNRAEARIILAIYQRIRKEFSGIDFDFRIGVITMYRAQLDELKRIFIGALGRDTLRQVDFNTVDGFQGQEKDIIILSCVRAGPGVTNVGFLSDVRRMNVALTRCRSSLYIVGHAATLERSDQTWKTIVQDARDRSCLLDVEENTFRSSKPSILSVPTLPPSRKTKPIMAPEAPPVMMTPKEIKAIGSRDSPMEPSKPKAPLEVSADVTRTPNNLLDEVPPGSKLQSQSDANNKREAPPLRPPDEVTMPSVPGPSHLPVNAQNATNRPNTVQRRPKPPANLFIPKKPVQQKRPPPVPTEGPAAKRPRTDI